MAKGRMLSVKAGQDPDLNSMSVEAELVFLLTLPHLDRDGLIVGDPIPLWARVAPRRVELMDKMPRIIQEWLERGLVQRYEWKDGAILFFPGFRKHNQNLAYDREPVSDFPPPPNYYRDPNGRGLIPEDPDLAGHLASHFDARSNYYLALMEASQQSQIDTSGQPPEHFPNTSRSSREKIGSKHQDQDQQQDQAEVEVENNNNSALRQFTRDEAGFVDDFVGVDVVLQKLGDEEVLVLVSWLWLYNGLNQHDWIDRESFGREYKRSPFDGIDNPVGYMIKQANAGISPPLSKRHRQAFADDLRQAMEDFAGQKVRASEGGGLDPAS